MALLGSCFLVLDPMLKLKGLRRWYFLSRFMHPFAITLFELYLILRNLSHCVLFASVYPYRLVIRSWILLSRTTATGMHQLVVIMGLDDATIIELYGIGADEEEEEYAERWFDPRDEEDPYTSLTIFTSPRVFSPRDAFNTGFELPGVVSDANWGVVQQRELPLVPMGIWLPAREDEEEYDEERPMYVLTEEETEEEEGDRLVRRGRREKEEEEEERKEEEERIGESREEETVSVVVERGGELGAVPAPMRREDGFYAEYVMRMRFFDEKMKQGMLMISKLLNVGMKELTDDMKKHMRVARRIDLSRGIEIDLELVYVGQCCLNWEALQRCCRQLQEAAREGSRGGLCHDAGGKLQQLKVILERFMETESCDGRYCDGKRYWNYIIRRMNVRGNPFLQVPQLSGHTEDKNNLLTSESMTAAQLLGTLRACIELFSQFLDEDNVNSSRQIDFPVEDVNDLGLLDHLTKEARKKGDGLTKLQKGKKHWWNKRSAYVDDFQRYEILSSLIDVKLVSRVLKMSAVSTAHFRWCEGKLNSICLSEGRVDRNCTVSFFPIASVAS